MAAWQVDLFTLANHFVPTHSMANPAERWYPSPLVAGEERGPLLAVKDL